MLRGYYHDLLVDAHHTVHHDRGWRKNLIVKGCNLLLAALMKGQPGLAGILFLAVGEGHGDWDGALPSPQPLASGMAAEILRRPIGAEDIIFIDNNGLASATPTHHLQISTQLTHADFPTDGSQPLREFALFGGDATPVANSGFMINHVIHPRIDITDGLTLQRTLQLNFSQAYVVKDELPGLGANLPVRSIDGVDEVYGHILATAGINTLADLVNMDLQMVPENVPGVKLREFRTKARMVMGLTVHLESFAALFHLTISRLLMENPQTLVAMTGTTITAAMAAELQEELMILQVALDDQDLQQMTLGSIRQG